MEEFFNHVSDNLSVHFNYTENPNQVNFHMHMHDVYELYIFFAGSGTFKVEGSQYKLQSGDIILLKKAEAHYFYIDENKPYIRLAINFTEELFNSIPNYQSLFEPFENRENGQFNIYRTNDFKSSNHLIYINNLIMNAPQKELQTVANLVPLLYDISIAFKQKQQQPQRNLSANKIIHYLNSNFLQNISIDDLCKEFFISKTHLCRTFKDATGTTINHYLTNKRLIYAHNLIKLGTPPTQVYQLSGYDNYSVFFRAYKKRYGISPSSDYKNS